MAERKALYIQISARADRGVSSLRKFYIPCGDVGLIPEDSESAPIQLGNAANGPSKDTIKRVPRAPKPYG